MSESQRQDLKLRTKSFALRIVRLYVALPKKTEAQVLGRQLLRSGASVGAHYREACRAKSAPDFINKIEGELQELEESVYWLELLADAGVVVPSRLKPLLQETNELTAIFVTMARNTKSKGL